MLLIVLLSVCLMACGNSDKNGDGTDTVATEIDSNKGQTDEAGTGESADGKDEKSSPAVGIGDTDGTGQADDTATDEVPSFDIIKGLKNRGDSNPIIVQNFGADPFAMVYGDRVYFYMTADEFEKDASGNIKENSYSQIKSIHVVSTDDMKNFQDHGFIKVAGSDGAAKWAHNSWAPSAAYKNIDGKDKFFLYFADNGGGIGVLEGDSPVGPFKDPIGKALISRQMPNCGNVMWLFDPAVLVDDDGSAYIYFGGGVPEGKASNPGTGRGAKLTDDMIGIDGDVITLDVPYLFEDSGIHKYNGKYYYSYCTNWNVEAEGKAEYGFTSGQIAVLESDSPMGPFTYSERVLDNPGSLCGLYGNNHHAIFNFKGQWYITYHSRFLEKKMGVEHGYRSTFVNAFDYKEDGTIGLIKQSKEGPSQIEWLDPFMENPAVCAASLNGLTAEYKEGNSVGFLSLSDINSGDYVEVDGVDFDIKKAMKVKIKADVTDMAEETKAKIYVRTNFPNGKNLAIVKLDKQYYNVESGCYEAELLDDIEGVNFLYFVFEGEGYTVDSWQFE